MSKPSASNSSKSAFVTILLIAIVVGGLVLLLLPSKPAPKQQEEAQSATPAPADPVALATPSGDLSAVVGKWLREDGGYQLVLTRDASGDKLNAAYFNPRPINVSYCTVTYDGGALKVRVELNDVGYPGSFYTMVYDRASDRLLGTYYQAAMGETYQIMFVRMP